jgi:hypothetical protein
VVPGAARQAEQFALSGNGELWVAGVDASALSFR